MATDSIYSEMFSVLVNKDAVIVGGVPITTAFPEAVLADKLGPPDRVVEQGPPAPFGHRNNRAHIYDSKGIYFNQDHKDLLLVELHIVFRRGSGPLRSPVVPLHPFAGILKVFGRLINADTDQNTMRAWFGQIRRELKGAGLGDGRGQFHLSFAAESPMRRPDNKDFKELISVCISLPRRGDHDFRAVSR